MHLDWELVALQALLKTLFALSVIFSGVFPQSSCFRGIHVNIIDSAQQGTDPNNNPYCGRKIRATRLQEGQTQNSTIDVTVVDRCVGCGVYDLDFSPTAFSMLANETLGRVDVSWWFLD
jgi:hypothetical protein